MQNYKQLLTFRKSAKEILTPYKICLVLSMKLYCNYLEKSEVRNQFTNEIFEFRQKYCLILLKLLQSPDLKYVEFKKLMENKQFSIFNQFLADFEVQVKAVFENQVEGLSDLMRSITKLFITKKQFHAAMINKQSFAGKIVIFTKKNFHFFAKFLYFC